MNNIVPIENNITLCTENFMKWIDLIVRALNTHTRTHARTHRIRNRLESCLWSMEFSSE